MCVSIGPSRMSDTIVYAAEARLGEKTVHVVGYQNKAASAGANAMLLPFPTSAKMGPNNAVDLTACPWLLTRMRDALTPRTRSRGSYGGSPKGLVQAFDVGSYRVVLAEHADDIPGALADVPPEKRPAPNPALFDAYASIYPGWPVALCCWDGAVEAEPLLWWYEPRTPGVLFLPGMDAHDGAPPDTRADVVRDHFLVWGSEHPEGDGAGGNTWHETLDVPEHVRPFVAPRLRGKRVVGRMPNGDWQVPSHWDPSAEPARF